MKYLFFLLFIACNSGNNDISGSNHKALPSPSPSPSPTLAPSPAPSPSPSPSPTPAPTYNCTNHPLSDNTYKDITTGIEMTFNKDCTVVYTDSFLMSQLMWSPDPNPADVVQDTLNSNIYSFPMTLISTGQYVCLPITGPQTCQNSVPVGNVTITVDLINTNQRLSIQ